MGLDFIRDKKSAFEQRRDASRNREFDTDLLTQTASDEIREVFRCILTDSEATLEPGYRLVLRAYSESDMKVSQAGKSIGFVVLNDAMRLAELMKKNKVHTGILLVTPTDVPDMEGGFCVRPMKPFKKT
jgi:hypothetical protein